MIEEINDDDVEPIITEDGLLEEQIKPTHQPTA